MNTQLNFEIADKTLEEHIHDAETCAAMRKSMYAHSMDPEEQKKKLEIIRIAELNSRIGILYFYYGKGLLHDVFKLYERLGRNSDLSSFPYLIDWGNDQKMTSSMSLICRMLSGLDVENIADTDEKTDMYSNLTTIIEASAKPGGKPFLLNVLFWEQYFEFYEKYHEK